LGGGRSYDVRHGTWKIEVATREIADGTTELLGLGFVTGRTAGDPTLTLRGTQHEYVFGAE
jgi:hypothetical protein